MRPRLPLGVRHLGRRRRSLTTVPTERLRNFGIIAHIDAGKTTISERMLFYAGRTRHLGEVHDGDTVMDHMSQERQRGITITSSCVSLRWRGHQLNLIDSPGHVDFTVEVERCMRVLDGAVTVVDAVAGVQVQTETVWSQAHKYHVPRIAFVNKMDREGADLEAAAVSIRDRLGVTPWVLQRPWIRDDRLVGVLDLVTQTAMEFGGERGEHLRRQSIADDADLAQARLALLETISETDDALLETLIDSGDVTPAQVHDAVRRAVAQRAPVVPVLCGAAYRNIGVQPLLDAVCDYLPSPVVDHVTSTLRAVVFKVVHDARRGPIAFTRVLRGRLTPRDTLRVRGGKCRIGQLLRIDAGDYGEMTECGAGDICAVVGLKQVRTGEILRPWADPHTYAHETVEIAVPEPVFFCSIEADSSRHDDDLKRALQALSVEDPSLQVTADDETGQTVIKGMGELHLEVVRDRLRDEFHVEATLGRMSVSYREAPTAPETKTATHLLPGRAPVTVTLSLRPSTSDHVTVDDADATVQIGDDPAGPVPAEIGALLREVVTGLRGPRLGYPLSRAAITLHSGRAAPSSHVGDWRAALSTCLGALLRAASITLLEPVVDLELHCPSAHVGDISSDLNRRRRAQVLDVTSTGAGKSKVRALVPLAALVGYATAVRSVSQGTAHFTMRFKSFEPVPARVQHDLLRPTL